MTDDPWAGLAPAQNGPSSEGANRAPSPDAGLAPAPPSDVPAEQAVLGAMLLSPQAVTDVTALLRPDDYYRPAHELIHSAVLAVSSAGGRPDPLTVAGQLTSDGTLGLAGGAPYLHTLVSSVPVVSAAGHYARLVAEVAARRRLIAEGVHLVQAASSGEDPAHLATEARSRIDAAVTTVAPAGRTVGVALADLVGTLETPINLESAIPAPWDDLNLILHPMTPGQLVVVGARPSVGKTVFGLDLLRHAALTLKLPGVLVTLEMSESEVTERILAAEARVPLSRILTHRLDDDDWNRVASVTGKLADAPLTIEDAAGADLTRIRSVIRRTGARLAVVDYLGLVRTRNLDSRAQAVSEVVRGMKDMARSEGVVLVVLAQLNRDSEKRSSGRPVMADLRESGEVEQAADVVILLHRPEVNAPDQRPGEIDVIVAKQRSGPTATVPLGFQGHYTRCVDLGGWRAPSLPGVS